MFNFIFVFQGTTAYVPQEAWIQNMNLRDNILFESPYVETKYEAIISACCLQEDIRVLVGGDQTEIGERVSWFGLPDSQFMFCVKFKFERLMQCEVDCGKAERW